MPRICSRAGKCLTHTYPTRCCNISDVYTIVIIIINGAKHVCYQCWLGQIPNHGSNPSKSKSNPVKVVKPLGCLNLSPVFHQYLQILLKHWKLSLYESCAEFSGTRFIFLLSSQIRSAKASKTRSKSRASVDRAEKNINFGEELCPIYTQFHRSTFIKVGAQ